MDDRSHDDNDKSRENPPGFEDEIGPTTEEVEKWARTERRRRQAWVNGPSDDERCAWVERERDRRLGFGGGPIDADTDPLAYELFRDANTALMGLWSTITLGPFISYANFIRAGRQFQERAARRAAHRRVHFDGRV